MYLVRKGRGRYSLILEVKVTDTRAGKQKASGLMWDGGLGLCGFKRMFFVVVWASGQA